MDNIDASSEEEVYADGIVSEPKSDTDNRELADYDSSTDNSDSDFSDIDEDSEPFNRSFESPDLETELGKYKVINEGKNAVRKDVNQLKNLNITEPSFSSDGFLHTEINTEATFNIDNPIIDPVEKREILNKIVNIFKKAHNSDNSFVSFAKRNQPKEIKKFCSILTDANIDFTTDLPLHLYSVYLLKTRNTNLPDPEFTLWPLPTNELITPRPFLQTTNFQTLGIHANDLKNQLDETRYTEINYKENNKRKKSLPHMMEFWHPKINALDELNECLDSIFERKINSQITDYADNHKLNKYGLPSKYRYQRHKPEDIQLNMLLKEKIVQKLDNIIDKLIEIYDDSKTDVRGINKKLTTLPNSEKLKIPKYGLDWLNVLSCIDKNDKRSKLLLLMLFNLKLDKDNINGPIDNYPADYEVYANAKLHRDKILKQVISKKKKTLKHSKINANYLKIAKKQKDNIRYNLNNFLNLGLYYTKKKRMMQRKILENVGNAENAENIENAENVENAERN
jgi:hypothetical protein